MENKLKQLGGGGLFRQLGECWFRQLGMVAGLDNWEGG